jgi:hypothetical protein
MWQPENRHEGWLKTGGKACIRGVAVSADWDPAGGTGALDIRVAIGDNRPSGDDRLFVRALVEAPDGQILTAGPSRLVVGVPFTAPGTWCLVRLCRQIERPLFCSGAASQSYNLLLILEDSRGQVVDLLAGKFGIRKPAPCKTEVRPIRPVCEVPSSELLYA